MENATPQANSPTSSNTDGSLTVCPICGGEPICNGLGLIRYEVPVDDPRFGRLFRCPNYPVDQDEERQQKLRQISNLAAYADKTFQNFETDLKLPESEHQSLRMAYNVAWSFAQNPAGWLLLEGAYGCGKTHLAAAVGNYRLSKGDMVLFITVPDLLDHLRSAYGPTAETGYDETFDRIRNAPLLILDDLGVENPSPWAQEKLFQLLNHRYSHEIPTVITTNTDLDSLDGRVRSRLLDVNLIRRVKIAAPDYRSSVKNERAQLAANLTLYGDMTFDTFDAHSHLTAGERANLHKALQIVQGYANAPVGWLVLMGPFGCGKTHLAAAIAHHQRQRGADVMFLTVPDLLDYLRVTYNPGSDVTFDQRFQEVRNAPFLVLDDLGTESATPWATEKLFQLLDHRYVRQLPTVITTSKSIEDISDRVLSRILDERRCTLVAIDVAAYSVRQKRTARRGTR